MSQSLHTQNTSEPDCHPFSCVRSVDVQPEVVSKWLMVKQTYIIFHGLFGGVELLVVGAATWLMNESGRMWRTGQGRKGNQNES